MICKTCHSTFKSTSPLSRCPHCGRYNGFIRNDGYALELDTPKVKTAKQVVKSKDADNKADQDSLQERTLE